MVRWGLELYALLPGRGGVFFVAILRLIRYRARSWSAEASDKGKPCRGWALVNKERKRQGENGEGNEHIFDVKSEGVTRPRRIRKKRASAEASCAFRVCRAERDCANRR